MDEFGYAELGQREAERALSAGTYVRGGGRGAPRRAGVGHQAWHITDASS